MKPKKMKKLYKLREQWKTSALIYGADSHIAEHYERLIVKLWRKHGNHHSV